MGCSSCRAFAKKNSQEEAVNKFYVSSFFLCRRPCPGIWAFRLASKPTWVMEKKELSRPGFECRLSALELSIEKILNVVENVLSENRDREARILRRMDNLSAALNGLAESQDGIQDSCSCCLARLTKYSPGPASSSTKNKNKNKKQQTVPGQSLQQSGQQPPADTRSWLRPTENPQGPTSTSPAGGSHNNSQQHNKATPPPKFPNFADDDDTWQLVTTSKPRPKRTVLFIGNLATSTLDESLTKFVQHKAKSTTKRDVPVHNTKIFSATNGHETNFARITINSADSPLLLSRTFWPRALHCRRWHFKEQQQQQQQDKKQLPEGGCEQQQHQQQQQQQQMAGTLDDAERAAALLRSAYNHTPGSARDDDLDLSLSRLQLGRRQRPAAWCTGGRGYSCAGWQAEERPSLSTRDNWCKEG